MSAKAPETIIYAIGTGGKACPATLQAGETLEQFRAGMQEVENRLAAQCGRKADQVFVWRLGLSDRIDLRLLRRSSV